MSARKEFRVQNSCLPAGKAEFRKKNLKSDDCTLHSSKGFTLIELMVAISVVAIMATVGLVMYTRTQASARDSVRVQSAQEIANDLEAYRTASGKYPGANCSWCNSIDGGANWIPDISPSDFPTGIPKDPLNTASPEYRYYYTSDGNDYCIQVSQEQNVSSNPNYRGNWSGSYKLRFGPYGPNGGLCGSR